MHEPGHRRRLIGEENNLPRLRKRQSGLNGARVKSHLAQKLAVAFVFGIEKGGLGEKSRAPSQRKHAAVMRLADLTQPRLQRFDGRLEQRQASPFRVLLL